MVRRGKGVGGMTAGVAFGEPSAEYGLLEAKGSTDAFVRTRSSQDGRPRTIGRKSLL